MYLPRIMIDRFGWPGFIAFAVPNVLGCAAFGYVVKTRERSEAMVRRHGAAMGWFSVITVAYHLFFVVWLFDALLPHLREHWWLPLAAAGIVYGLGLVFSFFDDRDFLWLTVLVYGASLSVFAFVGFDALRIIQWTGSEPRTELAWLAPTIIFGFLLCPYMDLTFHRSLQQSPSRNAFAIFGVSFAVMIFLTCMIWFSPAMMETGMLPAMAIAHILTQCVFTVGAHLREVRLSSHLAGAHRQTIAMIVPLLGVGLPYAGALISQGPAIGNDLYLRFLAFFGLVFPAYVLIFMSGRPDAIQSRRTLALFAIVVLISLPLYELGFLHHRAWLLVIPLAMLLALRALSRGRLPSVGHMVEST